jgi:hypothetical protein
MNLIWFRLETLLHYLLLNYILVDIFIKFCSSVPLLMAVHSSDGDKVATAQQESYDEQTMATYYMEPKLIIKMVLYNHSFYYL